MAYRKSCKKTWADSDKFLLSKTIKKLAEEETTMFEFEYTMCSVCPMFCRSCNFCWDMFCKTKKKDINVYIMILSKIVDSYYEGKCISDIYFLRANICKLCKNKCEKVMIGTKCVTAYLHQMKYVTPFDSVNSCNYSRISRNKNVFECDDEDFYYGYPLLKDSGPSLFTEGTCMARVINKLWRLNTENETSCEERNNNT